MILILIASCIVVSGYRVENPILSIFKHSKFRIFQVICLDSHKYIELGIILGLGNFIFIQRFKVFCTLSWDTNIKYQVGTQISNIKLGHKYQSCIFGHGLTFSVRVTVLHGAIKTNL